MKTLKPRLATSNPGGWKPDAVRGNRHQRGYGREWDERRESIRERAHDLCEPHLRIGLVHLGCQCDHKVPKAQGGTDSEENLHWVCEPFHKAKTAIESRGGIVHDLDDLARRTGGG